MNIIDSLRKLANGLNTDKGAYVALDRSAIPSEYTEEDILEFARQEAATYKTFLDMHKSDDKLIFDFSSLQDATSFAGNVKSEFFQSMTKAPVNVHSKTPMSQKSQNEYSGLLPTKRLY